MAFAKSFIASSDKKRSPAVWPFSNILQLGHIGSSTEALCHFEVERESYRPQFLRLDSTGENKNGFEYREAIDRSDRGLSGKMQSETRSQYHSVTDRVLDAVHRLFNPNTVLNHSQRHGVQSWHVCGSETNFNLTDFCRQYINEICDFSRVNNIASNSYKSRDNHVFMLGRLSNLINNMFNHRQGVCNTAGAMRDNITSDMLNSGQVYTEQMTQPMTNSNGIQVKPNTYPINDSTPEISLHAENNTQNGRIQTGGNSQLTAHGAAITSSVTDSCHGNTRTRTECGTVQAYQTGQTGHDGCIIKQTDQHLDEFAQRQSKKKCGSSSSDLNISVSQNELVQCELVLGSGKNSTMSIKNTKDTCYAACLQSCASDEDSCIDFQQLECCAQDPLLESQSDISLQSSLNCSRNDTTESILFEVAHRLSAGSLPSNESDVCFQGDSFHHGNLNGNDDAAADTGFASEKSSTSISFIVGGDDFDSDWSSDSDYDECDNVSADLQESIWNSFMTSGDPYNPMSGWQCNTTMPTKITKTTSSPNLLSGSSTPCAVPRHNTTPECSSPEVTFCSSTPLHHRFQSESWNNTRHSSNAVSSSTPLHCGFQCDEESWSDVSVDVHQDDRKPFHTRISNTRSAPHLSLDDLSSFEQSTSNSKPKKKVHFPDKEKHLAVTHHIVAWRYAYQAARKGPWEEFARDRCRFHRRIEEADLTLSPCLTPEHRGRIIKKLNVC